MSDSTKKDYSALREKVLGIKEAEDWSHSRLASEIGRPAGTVSNFLNGTYAGDNEKLAADIEKWLKSREAQARVRAQAATSPDFIPMPTSIRFLEAMEYAQSLSEIVVVSGEPGVSKSSAIDHYKETHSNVWLLRMEPRVKSMTVFLWELCEIMGIDPSGHRGRLTAPIRDKVIGCKALLGVDEAQYLSADHLNQLRAMNEYWGLGLALFGNRNVHARIEGKRRDPAYSQFYSRIGMRLNINKPTEMDMKMLISAWGIEDKHETGLLCTIGSKPGGLRNIDKTLKLATTAANGSGVAVNADFIKAAYERLSTALN
ncbi:AAA family ATPase [Kordiimonas marina]|uniref:AAA family ATPase n=1 Tax=Kordiimonas marina TaxID=2872312 RepID=UPI001FF62CBB|nr:AAA family ATPase [Kordiimonas marina]MCJ9428575.1 AAA family ATPase [Kordiimonas marina]